MTRFGIIFVIFLATLFSFGQTERPFPMEENAILWEIEGPKVSGKCYLFGTIHMIDKELYYFPKKLNKIITSSELVVMEIGEINRKEAMKHIMLDSGSFFDYFSKEQQDTIFNWAWTETKMDSTKFRASMDKMKPFAVIQMATQMTLKKPVESYEINISSLAKSEKIPTKGLETIEQQLSFFDQMSQAEMAEFVMGTIREYDKSDSIMDQMNKLYLAQNVDLLYSFTTNDDNGLSDEKQRILLDNRNKDWISKIEGFIQEKSTFIAVGAGHLGGPNGLIRLLEKQGYTLKPIKL